MHLKIHTPPMVHFSKFFHGGWVKFKWICSFRPLWLYSDCLQRESNIFGFDAPGHCLVRVRLRNRYTRAYAQIMQHTHTHKAVTGRVEAKKLLSRWRQLNIYSDCLRRESNFLASTRPVTALCVCVCCILCVCDCVMVIREPTCKWGNIRTRTRQWPDALKPKSYSLVEGNPILTWLLGTQVSKFT